MKKGFVALIALLFIAGCGPSKLVVKTEAQGNILENIQLRYKSANAQQPLALTEGARVNLDADNYNTFYVDLSQTSSRDHIRLISDMRNGLKVFVVFQDARNGQEIQRVEVPLQGIEGYRQENTVIYTYDRRGQRIGERTVQGDREAFGDQQYTDTSRIPMDINFGGLPARENNVKTFLLLDYSQYEQPRDANTTEFEGEELEANSDGETVVNVRHNINYREVYFASPRNTQPIAFTIIKPSAQSSSSDDLGSDSLEPATSDEEETTESSDDGLGLDGFDDL